MSQIFDALQKSEAERSGIDREALFQATEVLRRAERDESLKWGAAKRVVHADSIEPRVDVAPLRQPSLSTIEPVPSIATAAEVTENARPATAFDLFKSIQLSASPQSRLVSLDNSDHRAAEAFRLLGVRLKEMRRNKLFKKILITSTIPQEGKSMVSANLACTLAKTPNQRTLLVEGDVRRPTLSKVFGVGTIPGLCEYLQVGRNLSACIYEFPSAGLWFLPAGHAEGNPLEHLQSGKLPALMDQLAEWFDWIIIDSPPVLPLADTSIWSRLTDGILVVTRQGTTEKRQLQKGLEAIDPQKVIGAILNGSRDRLHSDYYYGPQTQ